MIEKKSMADQILKFNDNLSSVLLDVPEGVRVINPFRDDPDGVVKQMTTSFYRKYYNDINPRRMLFGSTPSLRGSAVTGVPFADSRRLYKDTGTCINITNEGRNSSEFLYDGMSF